MTRRQPPVVQCPACGRTTVFDASNRWRPFCSQRCKTIDLGAWASGAYVIAGRSAGESLEESGRSAPEPRDESEPSDSPDQR